MYLFTKSLGCLKPVDDASKEWLAKLKMAEIVSVEAKRPRNVGFHRKYWAMVELVRQNMPADRYPTKEALDGALKIACGIRTEFVTPDGTKGWIPGSISFAKMKQDEFDQYFNRCANLLCTHFLPGLDEGALKQEVANILGVGGAL